MCLISLSPPLPWCQELLASWGGKSQEWTPSISWQANEVLLIIDAFEIEGQAYSLAGLWQQWMLRSMPEMRLLVLGWQRASAASGYLDLLAPMGADLLAKGVSASLAQVPIDGKDGLAALKKLVDGHGEDSLLKDISRLLSFIDTILFVAEDQGDDDLWGGQQDALQALLKPLFHAWTKHEQLLAYTPLAYQCAMAYQALEQLQREPLAISQVREVLLPMFDFSRMLTQWQKWLNE